MKKKCWKLFSEKWQKNACRYRSEYLHQSPLLIVFVYASGLSFPFQFDFDSWFSDYMFNGTWIHRKKYVYFFEENWLMYWELFEKERNVCICFVEKSIFLWKMENFANLYFHWIKYFLTVLLKVFIFAHTKKYLSWQFRWLSRSIYSF